MLVKITERAISVAHIGSKERLIVGGVGCGLLEPMIIMRVLWTSERLQGTMGVMVNERRGQVL
jgi:hypothetical protein